MINLNCRHSKSIHERVNGSHKFTIKDYSVVKQALSSPGQYLSSNSFTAGGYDWAIYFYPHGKYVDDNSVFVSVFVVLLSQGTNVRGSFQLSLLDQSGQNNHKLFSSNFRDESETYKSLHTWECKGSMWGYRRFFYRSDLESSDYLKDDCLSINCTLGVIINRIERPLPVPPSDMSQCLKYLLESEIGSDIIFSVAGETFKAHKLILAACSPVFRAQFFGLVGNTNMDQVTLEEIDPCIFKAMLRFIYFDEFPNIQEFSDSTMDSASTLTLQHLLAAADRFGLNRLKQFCEAKLYEELSADTVATTLFLAEQHRCSQLKAICLKFAAANLGVVMQSEGFKYLEENCSSLVSELLETIAWVDEKRGSSNRKRSSILNLTPEGARRRL